MSGEMTKNTHGQILLIRPLLIVSIVLILAGLISIVAMNALASGLILLGLGILLGGFGGIGEISYGLLKVTGPAGLLLIFAGLGMWILGY